MFIIQFSADSDTQVLGSIKQINYQKVHWDKLRHNKITQCLNCQRLGHSASNCNLDYRCVKCEGNHPRKECQVSSHAPKDRIFCILCNNYGYPASYGCPFKKEQTKFQQASKASTSINTHVIRQQSNTTINPYHNVASKPSYSNVTKVNRPNANAQYDYKTINGT